MKPPRPVEDRMQVRATRPLPKRGEVPATSSDDQLDRDLGDLVDEDRRHQAVSHRRERDFRRTVERDTATLEGILRDLAEQRLSVVVEHLDGRVAGRLLRIVDDHVLLASRGSEDLVLVARWALATVAAEAGALPTDPVGHRPSPGPGTLRDALAELAEERPEVALLIAGRDGVLGGQLRAVGEDLLTIRAGTGRATHTFVPLHNVVRAVIRR